MGWHIVNVTPGFEQKIKNTLELQTNHLNIKVLIPAIKKKGFFKSRMYYYLEKVYPGYVFIDCIKEDQDAVLSLAAKIGGILNMHGMPNGYRISGTIEDEEMLQVFKLIDQNKDNVKVNSGISFEVNEKIKIVDGPFSNFTAIVEEVSSSANGEKKLKVKTHVFQNDLVSLILSEFQVEKVQEA
jgi:transcriptional antiterminator NusG